MEHQIIELKWIYDLWDGRHYTNYWSRIFKSDQNQYFIEIYNPDQNLNGIWRITAKQYEKLKNKGDVDIDKLFKNLELNNDKKINKNESLNLKNAIEL